MVEQAVDAVSRDHLVTCHMFLHVLSPATELYTLDVTLKFGRERVHQRHIFFVLGRGRVDRAIKYIESAAVVERAPLWKRYRWQRARHRAAEECARRRQHAFLWRFRYLSYRRSACFSGDQRPACARSPQFLFRPVHARSTADVGAPTGGLPLRG